MDPAAVAELLEEEERKAAAKDRAKAEEAARLQQQHNSHHSSRGRHDGRSNNNRYSAEREENDERRSRRSKDMADDEEMRDASDTVSANGSNRSRRRSRSPDPDRRDRPNHGHRSDRNDRGGDFYRGGGRMSRHDDDYYRPGSGDRSRYRERSPRGRDDRGDRDRGGRDGHRGRDAPPKRNKSPEQTSADRDNRLVFVQQLAGRLRTHKLKEFFEQCGPVVEAQIVKDRVSGRSKGVGYVEFESEETVAKALALTGQKLLDVPIIVQHAEADKNRQSRKTEGGPSHSTGIPFHRLYVGNVHFSLTEDDLKAVFAPFGELEFVQLQKEEGGRSKGYGFVQFVDPHQAKEALEGLNGFELAGRQIRVGLGNDKFTPESTKTLLQNFGSQAQQATFQGSSFSGAGGRGAHAGGNTNFDRASGRDAERANGASALDDTDVAGVNFSNYSRDALMRKLARTDEPEPKIKPVVKPQQQTAAPEIEPTRNVLIKNVYTEADRLVAGWEAELSEDMRQECEAKYGKVKHIGISLNSDEGEVFIKFADKKGGENAIRGLNGRYFGGNMLSASYVADAFYNSNFPKAANL